MGAICIICFLNYASKLRESSPARLRSYMKPIENAYNRIKGPILFPVDFKISGGVDTCSTCSCMPLRLAFGRDESIITLGEQDMH